MTDRRQGPKERRASDPERVCVNFRDGVAIHLHEDAGGRRRDHAMRKWFEETLLCQFEKYWYSHTGYKIEGLGAYAKQRYMFAEGIRVALRETGIMGAK